MKQVKLEEYHDGQVTVEVNTDEGEPYTLKILRAGEEPLELKLSRTEWSVIGSWVSRLAT